VETRNAGMGVSSSHLSFLSLPPFASSSPFSSFPSPYKAKTRFLLIAITQQSRFVVGEHGAWLNMLTSRSAGELWFSCGLRGSRGAEVRPLQLLTTAATSAVRRTKRVYGEEGYHKSDRSGTVHIDSQRDGAAVGSHCAD